MMIVIYDDVCGELQREKVSKMDFLSVQLDYDMLKDLGISIGVLLLFILFRNLFTKYVFQLIYEIVLYKGLKCHVVFDYGNGNLEILCLDEVLLVHEGQIDRLQ